MSKERFKVVMAAYVLLEKEGKVFLLRRSNTGWADGYYTLPTGHVDQGEHLVDCAMREAEEESGVKIKAKDLSLFHICHRYYKPGVPANEQCVNFYFKTQNWSGEPCNNEPTKCDDAGWFDKDDLPPIVCKSVRVAIELSNDFHLKEYDLNDPMLPEQ